nr:AmmeMemoRadiSam system protein B [Anaerolineae bacterium]
MSDIRPSPIAGQWYPGHPEKLAQTIDKLVSDASPEDFPGRIIGLIAPHAGYAYSGGIAAQAFRQVLGASFARVVIVSPMHHPIAGSVLTSAHQAYETPLGVVPIDRGFINALGQLVPLTPVRRDPEHSLEIELPFLQRVLTGPFELVPLMLRDQTVDMANRLGKAIAQVVGAGTDTLLVASSDLSHFYTDPVARRLDRVVLDQIVAYEPEIVIQIEDQGRGFACGRGAIATVLIAAREMGAAHTMVVGYGTSGDTSGDFQRVVGYGAAVVYGDN